MNNQTNLKKMVLMLCPFLKRGNGKNEDHENVAWSNPKKVMLTLGFGGFRRVASDLISLEGYLIMSYLVLSPTR